jgi:spore coat polysaccharide biosynthesis protein SpsF
MLPLDGRPVLVRILDRVGVAEVPDLTVLATTTELCDDVLEAAARERGALVYRGPVDDVLGRIRGAAESVDADQVVRVGGDTPLIEPRLVDALAAEIASSGIEYASSKMERTFPLGVDADAMTMSALRRAEEGTMDLFKREHVARSFQAPDRSFTRSNVGADGVFGEAFVEGIPDLDELRLTLDEPADYEVLRRVYDSMEYGEMLPTTDAISHVVANGLQAVNAHVEQEVD